MDDEDGDELTDEEMLCEVVEVLAESECRAGADTADEDDEKARCGMNRSFCERQVK